MNPEQIEKLAVAHMVEFFEQDSRFQTLFPTNDKAPGFDGNLNIYTTKQGENRKKSDIVCTFNTQIKGSTKRIKSNKSKSVKFKIKKEDLNFYEKTYGSCLFFYVSISCTKSTKSYVPYYRFFSKQDLLSEIRNMGNNQSKMLPFSVMPMDHEIFRILLKNYQNDLNQQTLDRKIFEAIRNDKKSFPLTRKFYLPKEGYHKIMDEKFTVYADYHSIPVPIGKMKLSEQLFYEDHDFIFKIGDYPNIVINSDSKLTRFLEGLEITKSLRIYISEADDLEVKFDFKINEKENMRSLNCGLNYFSRIVEDKGFILDGIFIRFPEDDSEEVKQILEFKKLHDKLIEAMKLFHMNMDEKLENVKDDQVDQVIELLQIKKGKIQNKVSKIIHLKFGTHVYYFIVEDNCVYNLFDDKISSKFEFSLIHENDKVSHVPPFFLADENISSIFNFDIEKIKMQIIDTIENEECDELMNQYELVLLRNYDKDNSKQLLNLSKFVNDLLLKRDPNNDVEIINKYQIISRMDEKLKMKDLQVLNDLINQSHSNEIKFAAKLLTNLHISEYNLENEFNLLSDEEKKNFKEFPIYKLWNRKI